MATVLPAVVGAILAFLFGLLATQINRVTTAGRRRVEISRDNESLVSVAESVPDDVHDLMPKGIGSNVSICKVKVRNPGKKTVQNLTCFIEASPGTTIVREEVVTAPLLDIAASAERQNPQRVHLRVPSLAPEQSVTAKIVISSARHPSVAVRWTTADDQAKFVDASATHQDRTAEEEFGSVLRNLVGFVSAGPILNGIGYLGISFVRVTTGSSYIPGSPEEFQQNLVEGASSLVNLLGQLVSIFFLLRMVPPAISLVRKISTSWSEGVAIVDRGRVRRPSKFQQMFQKGVSP